MSVHTPTEIIAIVVLCAAVTWVALRNGFYRFPLPENKTPLSLRYLLGAFGSYLLSAFFILPLIYLGLSYFFQGSFGGIKALQQHFSKESVAILYVGSILLIGIGVLTYLLFIPHTVLNRIFGFDKPFWRNIGFGLLTLIVAYPVVSVVNVIVSLIAKKLFGITEVEQTAVKELKSLVANPLLFGVLGLLISTLAPIIEEILFRGFFQTYLKRYLGRIGAIIIASAIFALAHFSFQIGKGNFELIISLFALSCYLGFIYERQQTLYAPIGLHMCFNASTVIGIMLTKG